MSASANIASHLVEMARQRRDQMAIIDSRSSRKATTYSGLDFNSDRVASRLMKLGVKKGDRVAFLLRPSITAFEFTFALFKIGAIPVFVDPGIGIRNMGRCLTEAEPSVFIGGALAQATRVCLRWASRTLRTCIDPISTLPTISGMRYTFARPGKHVPILADVQSNEIAAILFTSGSTGAPKGAIYTHGMFQEQVRVLREVFAIEPGEVDLCTFPLFALFAPALGMTSIIPDMNPTKPGKANQHKLRRAIQRHHATNMFGSPALVRRLSKSQEVDYGFQLPSLKRIICAGAPVPWTLLAEARQFLQQPSAQVYTPYGATEALPVSVIGSNEILTETYLQTAQGAGICVGRPADRTEVAIIPISDEPIADWANVTPLPIDQIGEITVRGPVVSPAYFNRPEATALAKIPDSATGTFWHRMGDVGYLDDRGRIWFCGRKSHRVITPNGTMFTIPCEAIFNQHPNVARSALVGLNGTPVICIEPGRRLSDAEKRQTMSELIDRAGQYDLTKPIRDILFYRGSFPVDIRHNAKINREKLAVWAARHLQ